jgi:hypothetical protein
MSLKSFLLFLGFIIIYGCTNPFTTRDVESPDINTKADTYFSPTEAITVFENLKYALEEKNEFNYISCLVDTSLSGTFPFLYIPDKTVHWQKLQDWQLLDERNYINKVFKESSTITFNYLSDPDPQSIDNSIDLAESRYFLYELKILTDKEYTFTGKARMKLIKNELSLWSVYYWEDARDDSENPDTWSKLKSDYKN